MSIFEEQISRKPDHYPWAKDFIESMHSGFWTDKEFSFNSDLHDFNTKLDEQEREIIVRSLSAVSQIEIGVKVFWLKLGGNLPHPSLVDLGVVMASVEVIHNNAYERLLQALGLEGVFEENLKLEILEGRVKYLYKYTKKYYKSDKKQFVYALILFTLFVENVSLFSQFYIVNWFNRNKNVLKDTTQQTAYTAREEQIHALAGIKIINTVRAEHPELFDDKLEQRVLHEAEEAYKAEAKIIDWVVNGYDQKTLNTVVLKEFIKNRLNDSLRQIGFKSIFSLDADLLKETTWFDEDVLGNNLTDFFYRRPVEYSKHNKNYNVDSWFNPK